MDINMDNNINNYEDFFKNNLNYNTFKIIFEKYNYNKMINYEDVKKIINCKKEILINLLLNKKYNFNVNIDYEIKNDKNVFLSINTLKHICLIKNDIYRNYHINNEKLLIENNNDNKYNEENNIINNEIINNEIINNEIINDNKEINDFFDNNIFNDYFNK